MSYTPLTDREVLAHYEAVAAGSDLPLCIYDNPASTHFAISDALVERLSGIPGVVALKSPAPAAAAASTRVAALRARTPVNFSVGFSVDWNAAEALIAGGDAWYSVLAGLFPAPAGAMDHLAQAFRVATRRDLPGTMVRLPESRHDHEDDVGQTLGRLLPANGPVHPAYCPVLTKMARHYDAYSVGLLVVEFANRIDGAGDLCTREVIGAFPRTQEVAGMIQASREACQAARREGCGRDKR